MAGPVRPRFFAYLSAKASIPLQKTSAKPFCLEYFTYKSHARRTLQGILCIP
jgi:hypothetical protein